MGLISDNEIGTVVDDFKNRGVRFYHACQFADFCSYTYMRSLPSRAVLERWPHTAFRTDDQDKKNDVWDKVFLNMTDFGNFFACGTRSTPNPYGPILLTFSPDVLLEATDVAICLASAGAVGFDRHGEAICLADVSRLFEDNNPGWIKSNLGAEFKRGYVASPEVSLTTSNRVVSLDHLINIKVDPYVLRRKLSKITELTAKRLGGNVTVEERDYKIDERGELVQELADFLSNYIPPVKSYKDTMLEDDSVSGEMKEWLRSLNVKASSVFEDYATYLTLGTLTFIE